MDISTISSQSTALTAYVAQEARREQEVAGGQASDAEAVKQDPIRDQVSLSSQAISAAEDTSEAEDPQRVQAVQENRDTPETRSALAKSANQAISAYLEASII